MLQTRIIPRLLHFRQPAGTSRGTYTTRRVWYVWLTDTATRRYGVGECAPLPALSCDDRPDYETLLRAACRHLEATGSIDREGLLDCPSILFGLETALLHLQRGSLQLFPTPFSRGEQGIPINGLIWMGSFDEMYRRIEEKMRQGFRCIKLKIGAIDFEQELELLAHIRRRFPPGQVELRVDANGAFSPAEAPEKLRRLAAFHLHSIEQPIRAGQRQQLAALCAAASPQARPHPSSAPTAPPPLPIALDEELIGINRREEKAALLDTVRPQYIVLKPSLHGSISGSQEWITLAAERGIGYWITSALESNIGLNALAQWCATLLPTLPQGLGTGLLFTDNVDFPLRIEGDCLWFRPEITAPCLAEKLPGTGVRIKEEAEVTKREEAGTKEKKCVQKEEEPSAKETEESRRTAFRRALSEFLDTWYASDERIRVRTSGSTGTPKELWVEKSRMMESARQTCSFLGLQEGDTALLCMPLDYIAGKMVVVRALVAHLTLLPVVPCGHPLRGLQAPPVFAAMTPMQVFNSLQTAEERELLRQIRQLIIGGGAIDPALAEALRTFPHAVWSTYGMTETLSHIALRRLNGPTASDRYTPLPGISIRLSSEGTLVIDAPRVAPELLVTNDLAEIDADGTFRILGRRDNILNSGGIKIQIEAVEERLQGHLPHPFLVTAAPDAKFGEIVVLLLEGEIPADIDRLYEQYLPAYWRPRRTLSVDRLPLTETGKPDRAQARLLAR